MANARILLVDDDIDLRLMLRQRLQEQYNITEAADGLIAQGLLKLNDFDFILSDIQMPHFSGLDLHDWISRNKPTPVVLMTAFSSSKPQFTKDLGSVELLKKPFDYSELTRVIEKYLPRPSEPKPPINLDNQFCKVSLENFVSEKGADVGIYVRISPSKYIKLAHQGGKLSEERIESFKQKNIQYVFVKKEDFSKILKFNLLLSKVIQSSSKVTQEKKAVFMRYTSEVILENLFVNGVNKESFQYASEFAMASLDVVAEHDETLEILEQLRNYDDLLYGHCLGVSTFAVMIGRELGWNSILALGKLATGGLFHDIGMKEIDPVILNKCRYLLSHKERHLIETHTTRGKEVLEALRMIPSDIAEIAYQHHEDGLGQGYPRQISKHHIHPLAKIVQMADLFCEGVFKTHGSSDPLPAFDHLKKLAFSTDRYDDQAFQALCRLFDYKPNNH